jgi:plastocyanin
MEHHGFTKAAVIKLSALALLMVLAIASAQTEEDAPVIITLDNVSATAWVVTSVEGAEGIADLEAENAALTLEVGTRYRFVNNGGANAHPLDFRDAEGNFLLAQGSTEGSFESDTEVDFVADSEGVTFTLTQALADQLATYYCTFHPPMTGDITIAGAE